MSFLVGNSMPHLLLGKKRCSDMACRDSEYMCEGDNHNPMKYGLKPTVTTRPISESMTPCRNKASPCLC